MPASVYMSKIFTCAVCALLSHKLHQQNIIKRNKMVVCKHLTHFCYLIRLVLHQHLNSHIAYPDIPHENSNYT